MKKPTLGMYAILLFCLGVSTLFSFTTPGGKVPRELTGQWQKGNFPMGDFFTFDGGTSQSADSSFALSLSGDGQAEVYLYLPGYDGTCRSHTLAHVKGTVQVDGAWLTLTGQSGQYRGVYADTCGQDFERPMTAAEVRKYVFKFYWSREQRDGKNYLVARSGGETEGGDYFSQVSWK
jgi:hypothetical protein